MIFSITFVTIYSVQGHAAFGTRIRDYALLGPHRSADYNDPPPDAPTTRVVNPCVAMEDTVKTMCSLVKTP